MVIGKYDFPLMVVSLTVIYYHWIDGGWKRWLETMTKMTRIYKNIPPNLVEFNDEYFPLGSASMH